MSSPFASYQPATRKVGVLDMIVRREDEISALKLKIGRESDVRMRRTLLMHLRATELNLKSWKDYARKNSPRVKGAVIIP